jgi:hypothetical protein
VISDTFLSMNTPAQVSLPIWLNGRTHIQDQILYRVQGNITKIMEYNLVMLQTDGGWSAIMRLPRSDLNAEKLLSLAHVITHPGSFYGIAESGRVVISLITPSSEFSTGIQHIAKLAE